MRGKIIQIVMFLLGTIMVSCQQYQVSNNERHESEIIEKQIEVKSQQAETKVTTDKEPMPKSDKYLHENPPSVYDGGLHKITYKYFQVMRDDYYGYQSIKFWNDSNETYSNEVVLETINPYKDIRNLTKIEQTIHEPDKSQIIYDISGLPNKQNFISKEYFPDYVSDDEVYSARISSYTEELYNHFEKEIIGVTFSIEVYNQHQQVLGVETTFISFDKFGNVLNTLVFDTPMYYPSTNKNGKFIGYIIGGFWGENFEIIYPETFRVYDTEKEAFIMKNDEFIGLTKGGGCTNERFSYVFQVKGGIRYIIIDVERKSYWDKILTKEEYTELELRKDGYYLKGTGEPAYLFDRDFNVTKF